MTAGAQARVAVALSARHHFEDFEFLAVFDRVGDRDRRGTADHHDGVRADALGAQDFFNRGRGARKLDALLRLVEPAADRDFGRNPSFPRGWQTLKTKTSL
jgi:hypothetical protein